MLAVLCTEYNIFTVPLLTFVGLVYRSLFRSFRIRYDASYHVLGVPGSDMMPHVMCFAIIWNIDVKRICYLHLIQKAITLCVGEELL